MRIRITFSKSGALRYTGHLDLQTLWERTVRRAGLPLAYTQGFHPGPKIQLASALPLGVIGRAEMVDLWLNEVEGQPPAVDAGRLQAAAPPGLEILSIEPVDERGPALQTQVVSAEYEAALLDPVDEAQLRVRVDELLAAGSLPRVRREKQYDLRPLIEALSIPSSSSGRERGEGVRVHMRLAAREGATGRPEEVLDALRVAFETARIERTRLILKEPVK